MPALRRAPDRVTRREARREQEQREQARALATTPSQRLRGMQKEFSASRGTSSSAIARCRCAASASFLVPRSKRAASTSHVAARAGRSLSRARSRRAAARTPSTLPRYRPASPDSAPPARGHRGSLVSPAGIDRSRAIAWGRSRPIRERPRQRHHRVERRHPFRSASSTARAMRSSARPCVPRSQAAREPRDGAGVVGRVTKRAFEERHRLAWCP